MVNIGLNEIRFNSALKDWLARAQKIATDTSLRIDPRGKKYIRIYSMGPGRGAFCFIEKATGDVLKAASWEAPAKHARGNIYQIGKEGVDKYGAHYLV